MLVSAALESRRATKAFDPTHRLSDAEIQRLLGGAAQSPTAFNIQNWRFVAVQDPELRQQLRKAAWGQSQVTDASLLVVMTADLKAWDKEPARYWRNTDEATQKALVGMIHNYYAGKDQVQRDEAMRSCGMAAMSLMLLAKEMGYDSCPMDGFDFDAVGKLINLPEDHVIAMFVAIGKATAAPWPRSGPLALSEVVVKDRF